MADPWAQFQDAPTAPAGSVAAAPPNADPWGRFADASAKAPTGRPAAEVQAEYAALPWYQKAGRAADDVVRMIANGASFGYADKLAGAMNGTGTEAERAKSQEAHDRAGSAGTAAELTGAVMTPVGLANRGVTMMGRLGTGAMTGAGGLVARGALAAVEGAGYGALTAKGNDRDVSDEALMGAIFGAGGNTAAETIGAFMRNTGAAFNPNRAVPTIEQTRDAANAAYQTADRAGVAYTPDMVNRLRGTVTQNLADMGYDPALQPGAAAVVRRIEDLTGQNITLGGLDTLRKVAGNGYVAGNASNNRAIGQIITAIDDAVSNPQAGEVLFGNAQGGAEALAEARRLWAQTAKANQVTNAVDRAELRAASTGKGGNVENATRQNLRGVLERQRGFTPDEIDALQTAVRGTPAQNFLRLGGSLAPTGIVSGGVGTSVGATLGSMFGGPAGAAAGAVGVPALGQASKMAADAVERQNVQQLLDIIMGGGTRAAVVPPPNALQRTFENVDNLSRTLSTTGREKAVDQMQDWQKKGPR